MSRYLALLCGMFFASIASAQIIYEPIQYQYGHHSMFYYGGSDQRIIANGLADDAGRCGMPGYSSTAPTRVYCDCIPGQNAYIYGVNASDAHNQANMNAPRYFRKRDLLAAAVVQPDGSLIVPAQAQPVHGTIVIISHRATKVVVPAAPAHAPNPATIPNSTSVPGAVTPGPVFIFPKELLDRPLVPKVKQTASIE